ncbi:MAG: CBS domain-containing protein [Candidatus Bathyarchaeia archaeon]|jgi:predicted transcriptional regulator
MGKLLETRTFLDFLKAKGKSKLVTVNYKDSVEKAIRLMMENKYSQLPIIKKEKVVGVISYESVTNALFNFLGSKMKPPSKFRVEDLMEKAPMFSSEDDLLNLLDTLANRSFVLVRNGNRVTDIITSYDALQYFRECDPSS